MVGFTSLVRDTLRKLQLEAEVMSISHNMTKRQKAFGVELYDLIETQRVQNRAQIEATLRENNGRATEGYTPEDFEDILKVFQTVENEIREPLEACRADIQSLESIAALPILIKARKETFGVAIWPIITQPFYDKGSKADIGSRIGAAFLGAVKTAIGKLSPEQQVVQACVEAAINDVQKYHDQKQEKMVEIESLVSGGTTLECCVCGA